jgi:hypothetical protein
MKNKKQRNRTPLSRRRGICRHAWSAWKVRKVLHLDNGQTWEQVQEASADLHLRAGDTVKIDRQLGDYWLSGRYGVAMKVRQKK